MASQDKTPFLNSNCLSYKYCLLYSPSVSLQKCVERMHYCGSVRTDLSRGNSLRQLFIVKLVMKLFPETL